MRHWPSLLAVLALAGPLSAQPDTILHGAIGRALAAGRDGDVLAVLADRLAGGVEMPEAPKASALPAEPMKALEGDVKAALTQLSILAGGNGHLSLQLAQASRTDVIYILSGTATLPRLQAQGFVQQRANGWRLSRPLVLWPGAALLLSPGELLELDTQAGAFVLSFGERPHDRRHAAWGCRPEPPRAGVPPLPARHRPGRLPPNARPSPTSASEVRSRSAAFRC